jgi:hypothetical protein
VIDCVAVPFAQLRASVATVFLFDTKPRQFRCGSRRQNAGRIALRRV